MSPLEATVGQELLYRLPFSKDPDGDPFTIEVDGPSFVSYNRPFLSVYCLNSSQVGAYTVNITLTDIHSQI